MITREDAKMRTDAYYEVERVLSENEDMFLTKEEIYARFPTNRDNVPYVTIASLDNALRNLAHMRHIEVVYISGKRYFGINLDNKKGW